MKDSGLQGASALIFTGICRLRGVVFVADTVKCPTIKVEDNITAVGTRVKAFGRASGGNVHADTEGGAYTFVIMFSREDNMVCDNGLYATLSAEEGDYIVYYDPL